MPTTHLTPFEDSEVVRAAIEIPNAAGGLREAMKFEPIEMHHGERVYIVLECDTAKVRFDPIRDSDQLTRVHVLDAQNATFVDAELVKDHLEQQRSRILKAREEAEGIQRLFDEEQEAKKNEGKTTKKAAAKKAPAKKAASAKKTAGKPPAKKAASTPPKVTSIEDARTAKEGTGASS